ncbi:MAG: ATP-binding protein [Lachnospiraceae bacterium]|jgi:DNA polymerase-3 subunit delta'
MPGINSLIENQTVKEYFEHAFASGRISHSYIIGGEDGCGKMTLARAVAQTLLCESDGEKPCGTCSACIRAEAGTHPDIIYPSHEKPTVFGVDEVRSQIVDDCAIRPFDGKYKIYIVDEGEKLSAEAQNALLKTIEEPPEYVIIMILTENPDGLLDTIRSRSVTLRMSPVSPEAETEFLKKQGVPEDRIGMAVRFSQGNIGRAMRMAASDDFSTMTELILQMLRNADHLPFENLMEDITAIEKNYKLSVGDILSFIRLWFKDVLVFKAEGDPNLLVFQNEYLAISRMAKKMSYHGISHVLDQVTVTEDRLAANVNFSLSLELLWMSILDAAE